MGATVAVGDLSCGRCMLRRKWYLRRRNCCFGNRRDLSRCNWRLWSCLRCSSLHWGSLRLSCRVRTVVLLKQRVDGSVLKLTVLELSVGVGTVGALELLAFELLVFQLLVLQQLTCSCQRQNIAVDL
jgi:hypothetical protein